MKEDNILVQAALLAYPEYERRIMRFREKIEYLTGLEYMSGNMQDAMDCCADIQECFGKIANIKLLKQTIDDSLQRLPAKDIKVIELAFFKKKSKEEIANALNITPRQCRLLKTAALGRVQNLMAFFGFNSEKIIELFDDDVLLIKWATYVERQRAKSECKGDDDI